jgi:hypothetical protein
MKNEKKARERIISTRKNVHGNSSHVVNLIMLIGDEMDHAELIIRSTEEHPIPNQVRHFSNGQSAPDYLFRRNKFSDLTLSPRPDYFTSSPAGQINRYCKRDFITS